MTATCVEVHDIRGRCVLRLRGGGVSKMGMSSLGGNRRSQNFHPTFKIGSHTWQANELLIDFFSKNDQTHGFFPLWETILVTPLYVAILCALSTSHTNLAMGHRALSRPGSNCKSHIKLSTKNIMRQYYIAKLNNWGRGGGTRLRYA